MATISLWLRSQDVIDTHAVESRDGRRSQENIESNPNHTCPMSDAERDHISHAEDNLYDTEFKTFIFMSLFNFS